MCVFAIYDNIIVNIYEYLLIYEYLQNTIENSLIEVNTYEMDLINPSQR